MRRRSLAWAVLAAIASSSGILSEAQAGPNGPTGPSEFTVLDTAHANRFVAKIRTDRDQRITILRVAPARRQWFGTIVAEMNKRDSIVLPEPPPPAAPPFALYGVLIDRADPRFLPAMRTYLRQFHALALR